MSTSKNNRRVIPAKNPPEHDNVLTPLHLARRCVEALRPEGSALEPCAGPLVNRVRGGFYQALVEEAALFDHQDPCGSVGLHSLDLCEVRRDPPRDFFDYSRPVTWIVTNPPWSKLTAFLKHSFEVADNVAFLMPIPGAFFNARLNAARQAGFGIRRILEVPWPREWTRENGITKPGYAIGVVHWERGYSGSLAYDVLEAQVLEAP